MGERLFSALGPHFYGVELAADAAKIARRSGTAICPPNSAPPSNKDV